MLEKIYIVFTKEMDERDIVYPNVAKAEDAVDPRRQGRSRSSLLRALDNKGDAVSSAFP